MNILIIGSEGYVGPAVCSKLEEFAVVTRLDAEWFGRTSSEIISGDIRNLVDDIDYSRFDCIVYLAAVSNDPMGRAFKKITHEVNHFAALKVAELSKRQGVKKFIFASSCSAYGAGGKDAKKEEDLLNPLTDYAISKVNAEKDLLKLANPGFNVYCLRFATACGVSDNLRLDLVVNDFVASAITQKKILVLSNGEPFRPIISVNDMAIAIQGVVLEPKREIKFANVYNVGSEKLTFKIKELAFQVAKYLTVKASVEINHDAAHDERSYRVNFDKFSKDFPAFSPDQDLKEIVLELEQQIAGLVEKNGSDYKNWLPHNRLKALKSSGKLNNTATF